ncbi:MAG: V-type ATP synthase subunit D [Desulfurococcaceae archaeon]
MSQLQRVRPTKVELIRLRRRLEAARKVHRILQERLTVLVNELMAAAREAAEMRRELQELFGPLYARAAMVLGAYGERALDYAAAPEPLLAAPTTENVMGVVVRGAIIRPGQAQGAREELADFAADARRFIEMVVDLGRAERAVEALGREVASTRRKASALNYIVIPGLQGTIKALELKFDEREREEKARLKRVKALLQRRRSGGR